MNKLIAFIEKGKPFFEKLSRNIYLRAIRDGFIAGMPVILFSSIFILIAFVPNSWGFKWSDEVVAFLMKPYSYSMGILALLVAGTTAKSLTDSVNRSMEKTNQINYMSTLLAAIVGLLMLAADPIENGLATGFLGTIRLDLPTPKILSVIPQIYKISSHAYTLYFIFSKIWHKGTEIQPSRCLNGLKSLILHL